MCVRALARHGTHARAHTACFVGAGAVSSHRGASAAVHTDAVARRGCLQGVLPAVGMLVGIPSSWTWRGAWWLVYARRVILDVVQDVLFGGDVGVRRWESDYACATQVVDLIERTPISDAAIRSGDGVSLCDVAPGTDEFEVCTAALAACIISPVCRARARRSAVCVCVIWRPQQQQCVQCGAF